MTSSWQCQFVNSRGEQCSSPAIFRFQFSLDHPFDHVDVCAEHEKEYPYYVWFQRLREPKEEEKK